MAAPSLSSMYELAQRSHCSPSRRLEILAEQLLVERLGPKSFCNKIGH
jgi:hypothetical protein